MLSFWSRFGISVAVCLGASAVFGLFVLIALAVMKLLGNFIGFFVYTALLVLCVSLVCAATTGGK